MHAPTPAAELEEREPVRLGRLALTPARRDEVVAWVFDRLATGRGGWLLTPNLDLLQQAAEDPRTAALYARADLRVADGVPLLWLARLRGRPLPERVAGSDLVGLLAERAAGTGHRLFLLGGDPGVAARAAERLRARAPGLRIAGTAAPRLGEVPDAAQVREVRDRLARAAPDLVYVALGSPKTELLIDALRPSLPRCLFLGCGISLSFLSGDVRRAPGWMRRSGLEWAHRLAQEPRRLTGRYLGRNLPFLARALLGAALARER